MAAWEKHNANLKARCKYLNDLQIESLHYTAANGTDLTVGMIPEARFGGGADTSKAGISFNPNIPSEECFISPMKGKAEGIVYSSKPLSYQGQIIDKFFMRFEEGKVVESGAEVGRWYQEWGAEPTPVAKLPINGVAPDVRVEGPVPELTGQLKEIHHRYFRTL